MDHGLYAALIAQSKFRCFAQYPQLRVWPVFPDGNTEHIGGGFTVDVPVFPEYFHPPFFTGKPAEDPAFNLAVVRDNQNLPFGRYKGRTDQFRQYCGRRPVFFPDPLDIARYYQIPSSVEILQMVLRQILRLDVFAAPTAGMAAIVVKQPAQTPVGTHAPQNGAVFG